MKNLIGFGYAAVLVTASLSAQGRTLYNNGPVVDGDGLSRLTLPATTLGFGVQSSNGTAVADDFTIAAGESWTVESLDFYAYQTGSTAFSFTSATWSVVSGDVNSGDVVASGVSDVTPGGRVGYRVSSTTPNDTTRGIYAIVADIDDFSLGAGTYWLRWSLAGTLASGPWQPPTSNGAIGNAAQFTPALGTFAAAIDAGSTLTAELPFTINGSLSHGSVTAVPEPSTAWLLLAGGIAVVSAVRQRRPLVPRDLDLGRALSPCP